MLSSLYIIVEGKALTIIGDSDMKIKTKKCSGPCQEDKLLDLFSAHKSRSDGKQSRCKECQKNAL